MTADEPQEPTPLPRSRKALAQARRVLDQLPAKESSVQDYRDFIPYVLDRLEHVWRTIEYESKGKRTQPFGAWWAEQRQGNRHSVSVLRNAELKRGEKSTRRRTEFKVPGYIQVHEDGRITAHRQDGSEIPRGPEGITVEPAVAVRSGWEFAVAGLDDRPAQEVLETVYRRLADETLPTAERLLRPSS